MYRSKKLATFFHSVLAVAGLQLAAHAATHDVRVIDHEFDPPVITIAPGDTVKWTAYGNDHTITADDGSFNSATELPEPALPLFQSYSVTFPAVGVKQYYCQVHGGPGGIGMSGIVRIVEPGSNTPPAKPTNSQPANGASGVSKTPLLQASDFSDADPGDAHGASQWIVRKVSDSSIVVDTGTTTENKTSFRTPPLENGVQYSWSVRYKDASGDWSEYSTETTFTTIQNVVSQGIGLMGMYGSYNKKTMAVKLIGEKVGEVVDFDWGLKKPHPSAPANYMYAVWEGTLVPPSSEEYLFRIVADGGVKLSLNGNLVIDDWRDGKFPIYRAGAVQLEAGVPVNIKLEYYDSTGKASIKLRWVTPTRPLEVVPKSVLYPFNN